MTRSKSSGSAPATEDKIDSRAVREWAFETGDRPSSLRVYRVIRWVVRKTLIPYLRVAGQNTTVLDLEGPTILAPVHRSHLDSVLLATLSKRRIRALGKESLFVVPVLRYFCAALGAIPVRRGEADRDALAAAKKLLDRGESMIVFPEGTRQTGNDVAELFDGAAWLATRTGARVVPVGIVGTGDALPDGSKRLHRSSVRIAVGDPMQPPVPSDGKRVTREQMSAFTIDLRLRLQQTQDAAVAMLDDRLS